MIINKMAELDFIDEPIYIHGFPWRKYTNDLIFSDFQKLRTKLLKETYKTPIKVSFIGYKCTDHFFQKERLSTRSDTNCSCVDFWKLRQQKILQYHHNQKYKKDLFGTIVFMKRGPAHFSPFVAGMIYKNFNCKCVLDPYAGWGDRCLAALALDINYIGIDSNYNLTDCYKKMINTFPHTKEIKFICDKSENVDLEKFNPDLIFTSPPFWNHLNKMVEMYNNCETNFETFMKNSLYVLLQKFQGKIPIILYINQWMYKQIIEKFGPAKFEIQFGSSTNKKDKNYTLHKLYCW